MKALVDGYDFGHAIGKLVQFVLKFGCIKFPPRLYSAHWPAIIYLHMNILTNDPITEDVDCILHSPLLFIQSNTQLYVAVYVISSKISCFLWFLSSLFSIFSHQTCSTCNVLKHSQDQKDLSKCLKSRRCLRIITSLIKSYMHLKYPATQDFSWKKKNRHEALCP